ncbi:hypothetical protein niasHS_005682 [Heterodera schachtii]|uniref:Uncharacterized protein n=1 Tax=Heterodera schachtii TaxID=97005 RepID=A0ABD2JZB8_HETSC
MRFVLSLALLALFVVQCSADESEAEDEQQFSPADEQRQEAPPSDEMPADFDARRKRSAFGDFFARFFHRNGAGKRRHGPPLSNCTEIPSNQNEEEMESKTDEPEREKRSLGKGKKQKEGGKAKNNGGKAKKNGGKAKKNGGKAKKNGGKAKKGRGGRPKGFPSTVSPTDE